MAKDDYYVIVYKLLAYLYVQLKRGEPVEIKYIDENSKLWKINQKYWSYIIAHLIDDGYVENVTYEQPWGQDVIIFNNLENIQISPKGIEYLCDNSLLEKAKEFLKDIKDITPFI